MTALLDANVLVALTTTDHVHHSLVEGWLASWPDQYATSPVTQGALVRFALRRGASAAEAAAVVGRVRSSPRHEFWADELCYDEALLRGVVGHRQVTDAHLAGAARARGARLATLDGGLEALHPDVAVLLRGG